MKSISDIKFIVVDVETTGSDSKKNRITDISCIEVVNGKITSEFSSLINPHQSIPPFISQMTGITYDMVVNAPEEEEISQKVSTFFQDKNVVFTAHNARFDFSFVNEMLERKGFESISSPTLCTLKLARRLLPTKQKKNVGSLAEHFNIPLNNRHRAFGDAFATARIFMQLLAIAKNEHDINDLTELLKFQNKQIKHFHVPSPTLKRVESFLKLIPDSPGIYKFLNKNEEVLYIGKAKCLKERVRSYFHIDTFTSKKIARMFKQIYHIKWECTNTELESLILESRMIKEHKPPFNTIDKKYRSYPFIKLNLQNKFPYIEMTDRLESNGVEYYGPIRSTATAERIIKDLEKRFKIRKCKLQLENPKFKKPCFYFHIGKCYSPCSGEITERDYMKEVEKVRSYLSGKSDGIIKQLEARMKYHAEKMEFEEAYRLKNTVTELNNIFLKNGGVPASINNKNIIILKPSTLSEKTINIFLIKKGKLLYQQTIGRKADLNNLKEHFHQIYFNGHLPKENFSKEDIDEIKIISNWINKQNSKLDFIYIEGKNEKQIFDELNNSIKTIEFSEKEVNTDTNR
jgi:DNA polymerase III subunit epsilon